MSNEISIDAVIAELKRQLGEDQFALAVARTHIVALQAALDEKAAVKPGEPPSD